MEHWHGLPVPNAMDGVAEPALTQKPIKPGETFTYEFVARPAGTFFYHSHVETDRQINIGLFAPIIIDPKRPARAVDQDVVLMLNEWRIDPSTGKTWPAMPSMSEPNYFTINGKAFPDILTITVKKDQRVRLRFVGAGQFLHPMHLHGMFFKIVATDGNPVPPAAQLTKDTMQVGPALPRVASRGQQRHRSRRAADGDQRSSVTRSMAALRTIRAGAALNRVLTSAHGSLAKVSRGQWESYLA